MEDICIICTPELRKASVTGKTDKGKEWIVREGDITIPNFFTLYIEEEQIVDFKRRIRNEGLSVMER